MYPLLLFFHSAFRWLILASLLYAIYRAYTGYSSQRPFTKTDNFVRHWTATIAHIQLVIGILLYSQSPVVKYFANAGHTSGDAQSLFFGVIHLASMLLAIIVITIGSALAKRKPLDQQKFKTMLSWFLIALLLIFLAIPWPFSPFANRPYFRTF